MKEKKTLKKILTIIALLTMTASIIIPSVFYIWEVFVNKSIII